MPGVSDDVGRRCGMAGGPGGGPSGPIVHLARRGVGGEGGGAGLPDRELTTCPGPCGRYGQARTIVVRALFLKIWEDKFGEVSGPER